MRKDALQTLTREHPNYSVQWSREDEEYVALCEGFPSLSYLDKDPVKAFEGILALVSDIHADEESRKQLSLSIPAYIWEQIRKEAHKEKITKTSLILKALKAYGLTVAEQDLIDGRTIR